MFYENNYYIMFFKFKRSDFQGFLGEIRFGLIRMQNPEQFSSFTLLHKVLYDIIHQLKGQIPVKLSS